MKLLISSIVILFFASFAFAEASGATKAPTILADKMNGNLIGKYIEFYKDEKGDATLEKIMSGELKFKRIKNEVINFGPTNVAHWLRFKIKFEKDKKWILALEIPWIGYIDFYKVKNNAVEKVTTGDRYKFSQREIKNRLFAFYISEGEETQYFMRIKTSDPFTVPLRIVSEEKFNKSSELATVFYSLYYGLFIALFLYNILIYFSTRSISYLYYTGYLLGMALVTLNLTGLDYALLYSNSPSWKNEYGFNIYISITGIFLLLFSRNYLDIKNGINYTLSNIFIGLYIAIILLTPLVSYFVLINFLLVLTTIALFYLFFLPFEGIKEGSVPAKIYFFAFIFVIVGDLVNIAAGTGLIKFNFFTNNVALIGNAIEVILFAFGLAYRFRVNQENALKKEKELTENLESSNQKLNIMYGKIEKSKDDLEGIVAERTAQLERSLKETSSLLNNIKTSVFAIGEDFKVLSPVSKYSETIFGEDIIGKKVSEFLFYNLRKGTKEYSDLITVFSIIFGSGKLQFFGLEDNLPKIITLPDKMNEKGKTLRLSYSGFFNQDHLLEKLLCSAEDVTQSEEHLKEAEIDQENYKFISEIMNINNRKDLAKKMESSIQNLFRVLEDFVSPLSDTYTSSYFYKELDRATGDIYKDLKGIKLLESKIEAHRLELEKFLSPNLKINHQVEATTLVCDVLETLLRYSSCVHKFVPVNLNINLSFKGIILEKINDIEKIFKNLFEYVFLVREVHNINKDKLKKVVQVAKLYPEFERTIDLIQQRSRLLSFLLKGVGEDGISSTYENLSSQVKLMPERARLTEFIIENNLISPYKEVLAKTKGIEKELILRIEERQKKFLDDKGYLLLLTELINRFIKESKEGPDPRFPHLPKIDEIVTQNFQVFVGIIEESFSGFKVTKNKTREKEFILESIFNIEGIFRSVLKEELIQAKALPVDKNNKNFIKFLRYYLGN